MALPTAREVRVNEIFLISLARNGGLPKYAREMAVGLQQSGRPFVAVCASTSEHPIPGAWRVPTYSGIPTLLLSSLTVLPLLLLRMGIEIARRRIRCVYFPCVHTWTPVIAVCARLLGLRVVVTFHDYSPHLGENGFLTRLVLRGSAAFASHFIFLSEHVRQEAMAERPAVAKQSAVVPHGLFSLPGLREKAPETLREQIGSILFIGRISKYKGVELLLEAFTQSPLAGTARLIIAGKSNYEIDRSLFGEGAEFIDAFLDEAEMARLINEADLVVLPYLEATQSGVATLAIDSATPVIATNVGGLGEQLGKSEAIFVPPDVPALRAALEQAAAPEVRAALCRALQAKKAELAWPQLADRVYRFCTTGKAAETEK